MAHMLQIRWTRPPALRFDFGCGAFRNFFCMHLSLNSGLDVLPKEMACYKGCSWNACLPFAHLDVLSMEIASYEHMAETIT